MRQIDLTQDNHKVLHLLRNIERFKELSEHDLRTFLGSGKLREYQPEEIIMAEGSFDCWVYFLIAGTLSIEKDGYQVSTLRRCGDMFGEMGVIDGSPRSATIRAVDKSLILGFDASIIDQKLKSRQISFCYVIYRIFAEVLAVRLRNETVENIRLRTECAEIKKKLAMLAEAAKIPAPSEQPALPPPE